MKTFNLFFLFVIYLIQTNNAISQECHTPDIPSPLTTQGGSDCQLEINYTPDQSNAFQNTPLLIFKLNFHFFRPADGSGIFENTTLEDVEDAVGSMNWLVWEQLQPPSLPVSPSAEEIPDARIRFAVNEIFFHNHDDFIDTEEISCTSFFHTNYGVDTDEVINVYYHTSSVYGTTGGGCASQSQFYANMHNSGLGGSTFTHELGHVLGLPHTFFGCSDDYFDDTYHPDPNLAWAACGPDESYTQCGGGIGISNNVMGYNSCRRYFSPKQLARMHYRSITNPNRRKYLTCDDHEFDTDVHITQNAIWNTEKAIDGNLIVESGSKLTIKCTIYMKPGSKVIVEQNAELIIEGGKITNYCNDFWQGIELWGTTGATQAKVGGVRQHGYLQIKNGGVIENAREGVSNWKSGDWNAIGGVIDARDGEFRNCRRAVAFYKHQNVHPFSGNPAPNLSKFSRTKFITDDDYLGDLETDYPFAQATLWGVDGVTFTGCEFINTSTVSESKKRSKGIYSEDAHYKVLSACTSIPGLSGCPEEDVIPTVFDGYYRAIEAAKVTDVLPIMVNGAEFKNNMVGVELANLDFSEIIFSEFELGGHPHAKPFGFPDYTDNAGVYSNETQCFVIEENYFQKDPNAVSDMQNGVLIYQSDANSNNVYRNTFSNLDHAAIGYQMNRNSEGYIGLHFMCNEMSGNFKDFVVARQNGPDFLDSGIRESQGSLNPLMAAGNEFSAPNGIPNEYTHWDINSEFNYHYHHGPGESFDPNEVTPNKIFAVQVPNGQSCPTNYQTGKAPALNTVISEFNQKKNDYYNLLYVYKQLIDDGDTEGTLDDIVATWPSEAWELHDRLMARSPYNSDTVLISAAAREIMPHAMLLEVLLANPDALRKGTVIKYVSTQLTTSLPSYMIDILRASLDQRTLRTTMQNTLADHHSQMTRNYNFIIQHYTGDSLNGVNNDSLIYWLEQVDSPTAKYNLAGRLMSNGSNTLALNILDSIPLNFTLSRAQTEEWGALKAFFEMIDGAMRNNRNIASLDSTELVQLEVLATNPNGGIGALRARKALCFFYENCIDAPFVPETRSHSVDKPLPPLEELLSELNEVKVFPNPAREYLTLSYSFFKEGAVRVLNVYDQSGAQIKTFQLQNQQGQQLWDTRKVPSGIYFYDIREEGSKIKSGKVVIQ